MNQLMIQSLKDINIPVSFMEYSGDESNYIIFSTIGSNEFQYEDDNPTAEEYRVALTLWYKDFEFINKIREIKKCMKDNGFSFLNGKDLKDDDYYGYAMVFYYCKNIEE